MPNMAASKTISCVISLEENPKDVYLDSTTMLLKLIDNILASPTNPKYRCIRLSNKTIANKLLPAKGAKECLLFMGFTKKKGLSDGDDWLELPSTSSLDNVKKIKEDIQMRRKVFSQTPQKPLVKPTVAVTAGSSQPSTSRGTAAPSLGAIPKHQSHPFFSRIESSFQSVLQYEDPALQARALSLIPMVELEIEAMKTQRKCQMAIKKEGKGEELEMQELMLLELLDWFKNKFFKWVDTPQCSQCKGPTKFTGHSTDARDLIGTNRVEVYECSACGGARTLFPRYVDAGLLLTSRRGRCGEWASCFTLFCRSLGWDARHVVDEGDHVWVEVYMPAQGRWVHCDPCENAMDTPLMYEDGWGKELSYVLAYSRDDIQDVTWRYTRTPTLVLRRRRNCREDELLANLLSLRTARQAQVSPARRAYLCRRTLAELVELLAGMPGKGGAGGGRTSGSLAWRKARGEAGKTEESTSHTWVPTVSELAVGKMRVTYSTALDEYVREFVPQGNPGRSVTGWSAGTFHARAVFRMEENDWNMVYLAREEGNTSGEVSWKFDVGAAGAAVESVRITCRADEFHGARTLRLLCDGDICTKINTTGDAVFETSDFRGSSSVTLKVELSGGNGDCAWQHAQLFRQPTADSSCPFDVTITFRKL